MEKQSSVIHSTIAPKNVGSFNFPKEKSAEVLPFLKNIGIHGMDELVFAYAMDTIQQPLTTPSIPGLVQFLQNWLPGYVGILTAATKIDDLIGISTIGSVEDEEIVQKVLENSNDALPYGDLTNVPLANWNLNYVKRTVVRFELGMRVGFLEEARSARVQINSGEAKRSGVAIGLRNTRNAIGFYGFNEGNNSTYGLLNDPNLPSYVEVPNGAGGSTTWASKTVLEIIADIRTAIQQLRTQSQDNIDPETTDITLAVATDVVDYLSVTSDFGYSVREWLRTTYPRVRVASAPQLNNAHSSLNVFYLFADTVKDSVSTDDMRTFIQVVPAQFMVIGVQKMVKAMEEDYAMATAGVMLKRPYACVRYFGI